MKTTRIARVLAHMVPGRDYTMAELRDAADRGCTIQRFNTTIQGMCTRGKLERVGKHRGNVRFRLPGSAPAAATGLPAATTQPVLRPAKGGTPPPPTAALRESMTGIARQRPRRSAQNFTAAPGSVSTTYCPKRQASEVIAADIAEFERNGGRVEKLGITRLFHHPADLADDT